MIFAEFEKGEDCFIIKEGRVKIIKVGGGQEILLSVLKDGDIFGELAIISNKPRNAPPSAWNDDAAFNKKENFSEVLTKSSAIASKIFMAISQRIWFTYIRLESKVYAHPITRIYAFLENKLLEDRVSLKSTKPVTLTFGIDELLRMSAIPAAQSEKAMGILLDDTNLEFNFGQVAIDNPSVLSTKPSSTDPGTISHRGTMTRRPGRNSVAPPNPRASPKPPPNRARKYRGHDRPNRPARPVRWTAPAIPNPIRAETPT